MNSRNADDFLLKARRIRIDYMERYGPLIESLRSKYGRTLFGATPGGVEAHLEYHARCYVVNALLAALNWRLHTSPEEGLPPLVEEAPVRSSGAQTIRRLDYLGVERDTLRPLLLVETKRPGTALPRLASAESTLEEKPSSVLCRGLAGEPLFGPWSEWLRSIQDYVRSLHAASGHSPKRVVISNGNWMVVFLAPEDAFSCGVTDPARILVLSDWQDLEERHAELFLQLEQSLVAGSMPSLTSARVSFYVAAEFIDRAMHGLRLRYVERPGVYDRWPAISVAPVIHLRSRFGTWLMVENRLRDFQLPDSADQLPEHLMQVRDAASVLLRETSASLGVSLVPASLVDHYESDDFLSLRGVAEFERDGFVLATGQFTHYLLPEPTVPDCPFHEWSICDDQGLAASSRPIPAPSIEPRVFFPTGRLHHCAHQRVTDAKASVITADNRDRCGQRSGTDGQAFCEIWRFETYLCCRTCAFEEVCTKADAFILPCQKPRELAEVRDTAETETGTRTEG